MCESVQPEMVVSPLVKLFLSFKQELLVGRRYRQLRSVHLRHMILKTSKPLGLMFYVIDQR